jgi:predicted SAM-dependent methyltransferase
MSDYVDDLDTGEIQSSGFEGPRLWTWGELLINFMASQEYSNRVLLSGRDPLVALHRSRMEIIKMLPFSNIICDLGGGSIGDNRGALVAMGYPHNFEKLYIVEPPPDDRHQIYRDIPDLSDVVNTDRGPVTYLYGSMSDLKWFGDQSVDLVFSGETIEHVSPEDCVITLREVRRILKKDGWFCFDTPNRAITKLQFPDGYINPDHKIEYHHHEMMKLLDDAGLNAVEVLGVTHMPKTVTSGRFQIIDIVENEGLFQDYENSYLLYYKCQIRSSQ